MKNNLIKLLTLLLITPALVHGMTAPAIAKGDGLEQETKSARAERTWTAGELAEYKRQQEAKGAADVKTTVSEKRDKKFIKTLALLNHLPPVLQKHIMRFDRTLLQLQTIPNIPCEGAESMGIYRDDQRWKVVLAQKNYKTGPIVIDVTTGNVTNTLQLTGMGPQLATQKGIAVYEDQGPKALSLSEGSFLNVWDLTTYKLIKRFKLEDGASDVVLAYSFNDMPWAVSFSYHHPFIEIWDIRRELCYRTQDGHSAPITCLAFYCDETGPKAVTGAQDKTIVIWDLQSKTPIASLLGHRASILAVATYTDESGLKAITSDTEKRVCIWDLKTRQILKTFTLNDQIETITPFKDQATGAWLAAVVHRAKTNKSVSLFNLSTGTLLSTALPTFDPHATLSMTSYQDGEAQNFVACAHGSLQIWRHTSELEFQKSPEQRDLYNAENIIDLFNSEVGGKTLELLHKIIYEYAVPEEAATAGDTKAIAAKHAEKKS